MFSWMNPVCVRAWDWSMGLECNGFMGGVTADAHVRMCLLHQTHQTLMDLCEKQYILNILNETILPYKTFLDYFDIFANMNIIKG